MFIEITDDNGDSFIIHTCDLVKVAFSNDEFTIHIQYTLGADKRIRSMTCTYPNREDYNAVCDTIRRQTGVKER